MTNEKNKIFVTRPALPELNDYLPYLQKIWESKHVTNQGQFHEQFERELEEYLGVNHVSLFANGTLALVIALQVMRITGEVITTPYSFVATTHALQWNGITPIFCDIEPENCNLDPDKIEALITPKTTAIMPVHVYGNPCASEKIQKIADMYGLKVIYDAAHAFGVKENNNSILNAGDLSILSFHGTKPFQTTEGGAIVCHDEKLKKRIDFAKNFGFADETTVVVPGINAKMNEMQAALGLLQLKNFENDIKKRKEIDHFYREEIKNVKGLQMQPKANHIKYNYAYFPVFINETLTGISRDGIYEALKKNNIFTRRYFYPLISEFAPYRGLETAKEEKLPIAKKAADQVLCLPIYPDLGLENAGYVVECLKEAIKKA